jgi:hypothetical protein
LKEVGLKPADLWLDDPNFSFLGQWHVNLLFIDRRKCVLFVNDRTLFNFIVPDVNRAQIRALPDLFLSSLSCVISAEEFPKEVKRRILEEYDEIALAKSSNRSVLGSANDLAYHYKLHILNAGGIHSWRVPEIIRHLNRMPMQAIKLKFPIEELRALYGIAA